MESSLFSIVVWVEGYREELSSQQYYLACLSATELSNNRSFVINNLYVIKAV